MCTHHGQFQRNRIVGITYVTQYPLPRPSPSLSAKQGMLFGAAFWSVYADKRGRRDAFIKSFACIFVGGLASALAPSFLWLLLFRAIVGFGIGGSIPVTTVLISELFPTNYRATAQSLMYGIAWAAGFITASLLALVLSKALGPG